MQNNIIDFLDNLDGSLNDGENFRLLIQEFQDLGFNWVSYVAEGLSNYNDAQLLIESNYPVDWQTHYVEHKYHFIDPVPLHARNEILPFKWGNTSFNRNFTNEGKSIFDEASEFGINQGMTIPVHGPNDEFAIITLADERRNSQEFNKHISHAQSLIHLLAVHYHAFMHNLKNQQFMKEHVPELSPRELECLHWSAIGKTYWEISVILGISRNTVIFHSKNAKKKLGATTMPQAIAEALRFGLIKP